MYKETRVWHSKIGNSQCFSTCNPTTKTENTHCPEIHFHTPPPDLFIRGSNLSYIIQSNLVQKLTLWLLISFLTPIIPLLYNDEIWRALIYPGGCKIFRPCSRLSWSLGCSGKHCPPALQWPLAASCCLHLRDWRARQSLPCKCILARRTQDEGDLLCSVWRSCDLMTHGANEIQPSPHHPAVDMGWRPHNCRSVWVFLFMKKRMLGHQN